MRDARRIIEGIFGEGVRSGAFSGAQAAWCVGPERRRELACAGSTRAAGGAEIGHDTLFDVASLTKLFTAGAALRLCERGVLAMGAELGGRVEELSGTPQVHATLEQLLAHEAGFVPWTPLYESVEPGSRGTKAGKAQLLDALAAAPPASAPDGVARYSDLGFIALGVWLERAAAAPLEEVVAAEVTGPLGLLRTRFHPTESCAATASRPRPGRELVGEVHDDNARAMGGAAGHAGLFSTAADVARLGAAWLDALAGRGGWLSRKTAEAAVRRRASGRGLGFDLALAEGSSAGARMGRGTFGHLGFTGCSLWIDPGAECAVALLTNRVHMGDSLDAIKAFRPRFHDALMRALFEA